MTHSHQSRTTRLVRDIRTGCPNRRRTTMLCLFQPAQVEKVGKFTSRLVDELRAKIRELQPKADAAKQVPGKTAEKDALIQVWTW